MVLKDANVIKNISDFCILFIFCCGEEGLFYRKAEYCLQWKLFWVCFGHSFSNFYNNPHMICHRKTLGLSVHIMTLSSPFTQICPGVNFLTKLQQDSILIWRCERRWATTGLWLMGTSDCYRTFSLMGGKK